MNEYYILDGDQPFPVSKEEWQAVMEVQRTATDEGRRAPWTVADSYWGGYHIKTVFTGHRASTETGHPSFFVTEVFRDLELVEADERYRCDTWEQATHNHVAYLNDLDRRSQS